MRCELPRQTSLSILDFRHDCDRVDGLARHNPKLVKRAPNPERAQPTGEPAPDPASALRAHASQMTAKPTKTTKNINAGDAASRYTFHLALPSLPRGGAPHLMQSGFVARRAHNASPAPAPRWPRQASSCAGHAYTSTARTNPIKGARGRRNTVFRADAAPLGQGAL